MVDAVLKKIEDWRRQQLTQSSMLVDGTLSSPGPFDEGTIADACKVSKKQPQCEQLHLLARCAKVKCGIEIGTNIGISSAYIGAAMAPQGDFELHTIDASPYRIRLAQSLHGALGLERIVYHNGFFYDTIPVVLNQLKRAGKKLDFAFIDGQHQYQPTLDFFNLIHPHSIRGALFVFDDIEWSDGMRNAWNKLRSDSRFATTAAVDGVGYGVLT